MTLQEQVQQLQQNTDVSLSRIAENLGLSATTISLWMAGTYKGSTSRIDRAITSYLKREKEKAELKKFENKFIDTTNSKQIFKLCMMGLNDHRLCVLVGDSGFGKTTALQEFSKQNPGTIYIEVDPTYNAKVLFSHLQKLLGHPGKGMLSDIYADCVESLRDTDRLVIIDQADILNTRTLDDLRCLNDKAKVGVVLAGMPILVENIRGCRNQFAQIYTRICCNLKINQLRENDIRDIVMAYLPESGDVWPVFAKESRYNARRLSFLIYNSIRLAQLNKCDIDEELVRDSAKMLEV